MPKVTVDITQTIPSGANRFWNNDDVDGRAIRTKWDSYVNSNKVTLTKNVSVLENGNIQTVTKAVWNDQTDYNEWMTWYAQYDAKRTAHNEANGIVINRSETIG